MNLITTRTRGEETLNLAYDAEGRLVTVTGSKTAAFSYDGDGRAAPPQRSVGGNQVKGQVNPGTDPVYYVNPLYEVQDGTIRKYYYAGAQKVAMRENGTLHFLIGDHLGSESVTVSPTGTVEAELKYKAWGETRYTSGTTPTQYQYTGQRNESDLGLYFYNSRWYEPALGRFVQADTIIPGAGNPQAWDRYAYTLNNPVKYTDPWGHMVACDKDDWACQRHWDEPIKPNNTKYSTQLNPKQQAVVEAVLDGSEIVLSTLFEPLDWIMTIGYCTSGECSPLMFIGVLPFVPSSFANKIDDLVSNLPTQILHKHHIFPKEFKEFFENLGIKIDDYTIVLSEGDHLKGVHGNGGFIGPGDKVFPKEKWNTAWRLFISGDKKLTATDVYHFADQLIDQFGLGGLPIVPYK